MNAKRAVMGKGATPGPWVAVNETLVRGPHGESVATTKWSNYPHDVNYAANARLIAAAPELLEACKTMVEAMTHMQEHDELPPDTCPADLYTVAIEAVWKAEGKGV